MGEAGRFIAYRAAGVCLFVFLLIGSLQAQILFSESFNVIIDTSKTVKGSILPDFKFQTQKENLLEFENLADISFRFAKVHALTVANKIEVARFGSKTLLSGGYLYAEYRKIWQSNLVLEPFSQIHWADARGLEWKYAGGMNLRYRIRTTANTGIFAGLGPFYEFERWSYAGVPDSRLPEEPLPEVSREAIKINAYLSGKLTASERLYFDLSGYYQARPSEMTKMRLASSVLGRVNLTEHLGLNLIHQFIYDAAPLVPIDRYFHKIILGLSVNF